jgi:diacylglycerol kinase family enzyme
LRVESEPPVPVQLDGDEWSRTPIEVTVLPYALRVLAPLIESDATFNVWRPEN